MKKSNQNKDYVLDLLIKNNSLHDLLGILANICENLNLSYLNPRIKHFRYFQFTFFGLMVKAKSLLEMMTFKAEFLRNKRRDYNEIYLKLNNLKRNMELTYKLINKNKMLEGKNKIIELNKEYSEVFDMIQKLIKNILA